MYTNVYITRLLFIMDCIIVHNGCLFYRTSVVQYKYLWHLIFLQQQIQHIFVSKFQPLTLECNTLNTEPKNAYKKQGKKNQTVSLLLQLQKIDT